MNVGNGKHALLVVLSLLSLGSCNRGGEIDPPAAVVVGAAPHPREWAEGAEPVEFSDDDVINTSAAAGNSGEAPPDMDGATAAAGPTPPPTRQQGQGTPGEPCPLTATVIPAWECREFALQMEAQERDLDLEGPGRMYRGREATITALLRHPDEHPGAPSPGSVRATRRIGATPYMAARLTGDGFDISPSGWQPTSLGSSREWEWQWKVIPKREGRRRLQVTVVPQVVQRDGTRVNVGRHLRRALEVEVVVHPAEQSLEASEGLQTQFGSWAKSLGALAALIAAAGGVYAAFIQFKKKLRPGSRVPPSPEQA
ncbi:MAG: hypothetical protein M3N07_02535 [Pseudomonadota bacterium]|nr:hypothetical protein [Pseudomonadota bacterium]